jgi:hypothetical protein
MSWEETSMSRQNRATPSGDIWVGMGKMDNVEHVKGQGYRLKKGKTSPAASKGHRSK